MGKRFFCWFVAGTRLFLSMTDPAGFMKVGCTDFTSVKSFPVFIYFSMFSLVPRFFVARQRNQAASVAGILLNETTYLQELTGIHLSVLRRVSPRSRVVLLHFSNCKTFSSSNITQRDLTALASCQGPKKLIKPLHNSNTPPPPDRLSIHRTPERYKTPDGKLKTPIKLRYESCSFCD